MDIEAAGYIGIGAAMLDFLSKNSQPEKRMSDVDRSWRDTEMSTMSTMKAYFENNEIFSTFAGAVFALHQDTLRAYNIDMRKTDDVLLGAALDKMRPSPLGDFPKRVSLTMEGMARIDNQNLDFLDNPQRPANVSDEEFRLHLLMAQMRSTAARVWLLTMYSKVKGEELAGMRLGVTNMWMMLQMVPRSAVQQSAEIFTGTFYNNIRSEPMDLTMWQQNS